MIFRQLFDSVSFTYTYLLASRLGGEALIIDPVIDRVDHYLTLMKELDLRLVKAVDTHCHADHITGLGKLRDVTHCITVMGRESDVDVVSMRVDDGDKIEIENLAMDVLYTPGHTDDSYSFVMNDRVFTGDTLLIRGTGRTDFQNGDPRAAYDSIVNKLLKLPEDLLVYPAHDYKGDSVSTIAEERAFNPRLQVSSADEYAEIMNNLNLPNPKMMDQAVPANLHIGYRGEKQDIVRATVPPEAASRALEEDGVLLVDLREQGERRRDGVIPGSVHVPYAHFSEQIGPGGLLTAMAKDNQRPILLYCAYGERSALALEDMLAAGFRDIRHLGGGIAAWSKAGGLLEFPGPP